MQPHPGVTPRSYRVPIVVLSALLFVLVGGIVVVLSARAGGRAPCPVGEWTVESYRDAVPVDAIGQTLTFTGGAGTILRLRGDGTGETDYGAGVTFTAAAPDGRTVKIEVSGPARFRYELTAAGGDISVTPVSNDTTSQLFIGATRLGAPAKYSDSAKTRSYRLVCRQDSLTQDDDQLAVGYRRR
ncbi:hypothetical protein DFJ67_2301 [Asanoa ferruginea]|uniref:Uncharacterized protein n=1 Tax=Asanoa ferruginea TaxID=53367 RepID=A0A3D9ZIH8_9ACTN|nr:hypothetical protein [Asanoa ferruginea]REF96324.1 hypothetical protein DFJ67_2301 [Asanoa ferruginea]GIF46973.1 hypothetical protein Afe04nite_15120 [Asanoa ferruginea]